MRNYFILFCSVFLVAVLAAQDCYDTAQPLVQYYIVGEEVNVWEAPSWQAKVVQQVGWGTTFAVIESTDNWRKVLSEDESNCYYIPADYLCDTTTFVELATSLTLKSPRTYYELLKLLNHPKGKEQQEAFALELLQARIDARTMIRLEACTDVNYFAYQILAKRYLATDRSDRLRVLRAISKQTATWVRLDLAKAAIDGHRLDEAQRYLTEVFQSGSETLFIDPGCEYDAQQSRVSIANFEAYCQALYWNLSEEKAAAFLTFIGQVADFHADEKHREIAKGIVTLINEK